MADRFFARASVKGSRPAKVIENIATGPAPQHSIETFACLMKSDLSSQGAGRSPSL